MNLVQVLPNTHKCPCVSIKHALKKQGIKTLKPLISQGFQVSVSILVTQDGCGDRTRTCDLRVMRQSQGKIGVISAPICAFCRRSLGGFSIVSVQSCPLFSDSGSKLGQTRCTRTHSNSVSSSIAPEATARPTSTTSSLVQSSRIPLTSRAELTYD